mgnify:CR=1 FL=1
MDEKNKAILAKTVRVEGFFESKTAELTAQVSKLEGECAELVVSNKELSERCAKLATRHPTWPQGYKPRKYVNNGSR